jgi:hypothetical protein
MDEKTFSLVAGVIFAVVALFHLVRIFAEWTVIIGDWSVPKWVSWGRPHRRWWPRPSRVETRPARRVGVFSLTVSCIGPWSPVRVTISFTARPAAALGLNASYFRRPPNLNCRVC